MSTPTERLNALNPVLRGRVLQLRYKLNCDKVPVEGRRLVLDRSHGFEDGDMLFGFTIMVPPPESNIHVFP
jgi:hypothetical protein